MSKTFVFPTRLSELIRVGLRGLEKAEANERYTVNMEAAFIDNRYGSINVCLGGIGHIELADGWDLNHTANMNGSELSNLAASVGLLYEDFRSDYIVLNLVRLGKLEGALELMNLPTKGVSNTDFLDYHEDPVAFKEALEGIANDLEQLGV